MSKQRILEEYLREFDEGNSALIDTLKEQLIRGNPMVSIDCDFNEDIRTITGNLVAVLGEEAFVSTSIGNCVGDIYTMEFVE